MRHFAAFLLFCSAILFLGCPQPSYCDINPGSPVCAPASSTVIPPAECDTPPAEVATELTAIPYLTQECTELCWAASVDMIAQYFGAQVQECQLASTKIEFQYGSMYNCCYSGACNDQNCNQPATADVVAAVLGHGLGIHGLLLSRPLTEYEIQLELTNGRPILVGFQGPFNGHAAVMVGYSPGPPSMYHIYDPWPQFGAFQTDYDSLLQGPMSPWATSFVMMHTGNSVCKN